MGIRDLNVIIKKHASEAMYTIEAIKMSGTRIAVDTSIIMNQKAAIINKNTVVDTNHVIHDIDRNEIEKDLCREMVLYAIKLMSCGITPVFVFDGKNLPDKDEVKKQRAATRTANLTRIEVLKNSIRKDILTFDPKELVELTKLLSTTISLSYSGRMDIYSVLEIMGIPVIQAPNEADGICAKLCKEGLVSGVLTTDTDQIAYGTSLVLTSFKKINGTYCFTCVDSNVVRTSLNMNNEQFVDLCICLQCDYNHRVKGLGAVKNLKLIRDYGSIDNFPSTDYKRLKLPEKTDFKCLNHVRCRQIFSNSDLEGYPLPDTLNVDRYSVHTSRDYLERVGLASMIGPFIETVNRMKVPLKLECKTQNVNLSHFNIPISSETKDNECFGSSGIRDLLQGYEYED